MSSRSSHTKHSHTPNEGQQKQIWSGLYKTTTCLLHLANTYILSSKPSFKDYKLHVQMESLSVDNLKSGYVVYQNNSSGPKRMTHNLLLFFQKPEMWTPLIVRAFQSSPKSMGSTVDLRYPHLKGFEKLGM